VFDELNLAELKQGERFVRETILKQVGSSMKDPRQLLVLARPALQTQNSINARSVVPMDGFAPILLPLSRNEGRKNLPGANACLGGIIYFRIRLINTTPVVIPVSLSHGRLFLLDFLLFH
jgi:hypothetical protein